MGRLLQAGDPIPHFEVHDLRGRRVRYTDVWQQRQLLLVALPEHGGDALAAALTGAASRLDHTACVVTRDAVPEIVPPAVAIADRWGEIVHVVHAHDAAALPGVEDLLEWVEYARMRCPECEGEAK